MSATLLRMLQTVIGLLIVAMIATCTLLMTLWGKKAGVPNPAMPLDPGQSTSSGGSTTAAATHQTQVQTQLVQQQPAFEYSCNLSNLAVLGKPLDNCATLEAVKLAEEEDIYVSVKTASKNHVARMLPVLLTWLQTVKPQQIHVVTDVISKDEVLYQIASKTGLDVIATDCTPNVHTYAALCCKTRNEYWRYFNTTKKSGELYRWYCHFDDDVYVNVPVLVAALREAMNKSADGGVYFGRWPAEKLPNKPRGIRVLPKTLNALGFDFKEDLYAKWATGAAYCISSMVMKKIRDILRKHTFEEYCTATRQSDDVTAAVLVGIAGYFVSDNKKVKTHYDTLKAFSVSELRNLVTIGQQNTNVVQVPDTVFSLKEDMTRTHLPVKFILPWLFDHISQSS